MPSSPRITTIPQPHPLAIYGGAEEPTSDTQDSKVLLRSGHTVRVRLSPTTAGEIRDYLQDSEDVRRRQAGTLELPLGEVMMSEIVGLFAVES